ncbi:hypothetical protein [Pseudanabaena mucicola]|uniref:hypothetical protein n=1 Tax=Pseudanabaena mucicola TaxID=71190 RepID=UPI002576A57D|nr:hypothetical protein [Pseudanabaena mucicola]
MSVEQIVNNSIPQRSVIIPEDILQELKYLAQLMGVPLSVALRHAIATDSYIQSELKENSKFLIKKQGGSMQEISWTAAKDVEKILQSLPS